jgi:hypothetical protein
MHGARDDRLTGYDFDAGHPLAPMRVELTMELARALACLRGWDADRAPGVRQDRRDLTAAGARSGSFWPTDAALPGRLRRNTMSGWQGSRRRAADPVRDFRLWSVRSS